MRTEPVTASVLYFPVREVTWPPKILPVTAASIIGVSSDPDLVAETPITPCMNKGM